jgi:trehalose 6-phosphate synthase/phosphatase
MANLTIVSNRLPVSVKKVDGKLEFGRGIGGVATGLASYMTDNRNKWIGWPGIASDNLTKADRAHITAELRKQNCYPVFLTQRQVDGFYNGYANRFLWPLFHDLPLSKSALPKEVEYWAVYEEVNKLYAREVLKLSAPGNHVWVHDYQLMLLPALLRAERPRESIGFFLHIPVPSPKGFSKLQHGAQLVEGVLGSDLVGLQTTDYTHNFFDLVEYYKLGKNDGHVIHLDNRTVRATEFPIGIDYEKWKNAGRLKKVRDYYAQLRAKYGRQKIVISADRLDPTKGIPQRLRAYRMFLDMHPEARGKVQYVVVAAPSRTDIEEYQELKNTIDKLVVEINNQFGTARWRPIDYHNETWSFEQLRALYQIADVGVFTPLRDGMNLMVKEFLASKSGSGVLVLSRTAGAAEELHQAILVNPRDEQSILKGLERALTLPKSKFQQPLASMQRIIRKSTIHTWAAGFMSTLRESPAPVRVKLQTRYLSTRQRNAIITKYRISLKRLLLLDYDGALRPIVQRAEDATPPVRLKQILSTLAATPGTDVVVVSGRRAENLDEWLGDTGVHFAAEHGAYRRRQQEDWQLSPSNAAPDWQEKVLPLLEQYAAETPGATVEQKSTALVWHYRLAKPYFAQKNLITLKRLLEPLAPKLGLTVHQGKKILEVKAEDIHKGMVADQWLQANPDFVLVVGDDYTDEDMFRAAPPDAITIKVGKGPTVARYRAQTVDDVLGLLYRL